MFYSLIIIIIHIHMISIHDDKMRALRRPLTTICTLVLGLCVTLSEEFARQIEQN